MSVIPFTSIYYPESDGKPMGETDLHREEMVRVIHSLQRFFAGRKVYVSGDLLLYYEQGNPKKFVVPDVFVVKDVDPHPRRVYKLWVERTVPDVVIEVTSRKSKKTDTTKKPDLYRQLRVPEYFMFDPTQDYLDPPLQGYRAVGERYELIAPDSQGTLLSEQLAMRLEAKDQHLVFYRLDTGERLLTDDEARQRSEEARERSEEARQRSDEARKLAEAAREAEAIARRAAETELARLREELRRLKS